WEEQNLKEFGFSEQLLTELRLLKKMIDSYKRKPTDEEILIDPEWQNIIQQSKKIVELWNA
ncbi:MAG: hypothetical protein H0U27_00010, partial [Nitrosopumilus sp.]|nr:hypothetical protein [Nitrosopumilus sp.]